MFIIGDPLEPFVAGGNLRRQGQLRATFEKSVFLNEKRLPVYTKDDVCIRNKPAPKAARKQQKQMATLEVPATSPLHVTGR